MHDKLRNIVDCVFQVEVVSVAVQALVLALGKRDSVTRVAKFQRILGLVIQPVAALVSLFTTEIRMADSQEHFRIRNSANEDSPLPQEARDVFHHHPCLGGRLEGVVHAELHAHIVVEILLSQILGQDVTDRALD